MRILVDISPVSSRSTSSHKVRGVGRYINLLYKNLPKYDDRNEYIFSDDVSINKEKIDAIHYPYLDPFFVTFPIVKKHKTVITVHDLIPITHKVHFPAGIKGNVSWQINKRIIRNADRIITDSIASSKSVLRLTGASSNNINHVYLGVEESFRVLNLESREIESLRNKFSLPKNFFLYVGDVTWNKNLPTLVRAVKDSGVNLVMVGKALVDEFDHSNPWNRDRIKVEEETRSGEFIKLGFVQEEDLVRLYNTATAVVMPSVDEGFGLPVLEGMSCGSPVIVSKNGSLPEVAGNAGIYVNAGSTESIIGAFKMLENMEFKKKKSLESLSQAKKFSIKKMILDTVKVYESL